MRFAIAIGAAMLASTSYAQQSKEEMMAAFLNLQGHLCAKVIEVTPLKVADQLEVTCQQYRGGRGRARYIVDLKAGRAFKA